MEPTLHDPCYRRPIEARYLDPVDVIWLATARRLGLHIRRDPSIFSRTDGTGLLALGPREDLDPDDNLSQMILHELCHWITNGLETFSERDWGFELDDAVNVKEHACVRLQCWVAQRFGMRGLYGPTGIFRQYYDGLPADPLAPVDDGAWEAQVCALARDAVARAQGAPWWTPLREAMTATAAIRGLLQPFLADYATEIPDDPLPSLWAR